MFPETSILALHGFTGCGSDFDALKHFFENKPVSWSAPNLHTAERSLGIDELCSSLAETWEHSIGTQRILLGYSMGGRIALHLAKKIRFSLGDGIILISASPGLESPQERESRISADTQLAAKIRSAESAKQFYDIWQKHPLIATQGNTPEPWRSRLLHSRANADRETWAKSLENLGTGVLQPLWGDLDKITTPALLLTGEHDEKFSKIGREMARHMPNSVHKIIPDCGHAPQLENPAVTVETISGFIEKCRNVKGR